MKAKWLRLVVILFGVALAGCATTDDSGEPVAQPGEATAESVDGSAEATTAETTTDESESVESAGVQETLSQTTETEIEGSDSATETQPSADARGTETAATQTATETPPASAEPATGSTAAVTPADQTDQGSVGSRGAAPAGTASLDERQSTGSQGMMSILPPVDAEEEPVEVASATAPATPPPTTSPATTGRPSTGSSARTGTTSVEPAVTPQPRPSSVTPPETTIPNRPADRFSLLGTRTPVSPPTTTTSETPSRNGAPLFVPPRTQPRTSTTPQMIETQSFRSTPVTPDYDMVKPDVPEPRINLPRTPFPQMINPLEPDAYDRSAEMIIDELMAGMTLRDKIGQRFIYYVDRDGGAAQAIRDYNESKPAGFILYRWNYETPDDVRELAATLQTAADRVQPAIDLLIMADQEGGRVRAFRFDNVIQLPTAHQIGLLASPAAVYGAARITAAQLQRLGVNMNLAPVLDLYPYDDETIIGDRSYGGDAALVSQYAGEYVSAFQAEGMISTAKHFPGHGSTTTDTHGDMPSITRSLDQLLRYELRPFQEAIDAGVPVVMLNHVLFPRIDPTYPASISRTIVRDILRDQMGFDGVVMTDGLEMGALARNFDIETTLREAFGAGIDLILLYFEYTLSEMIDIVEGLVEEGRITEQMIDEGVRRVLRMKMEYGLLDWNWTGRVASALGSR